MLGGLIGDVPPCKNYWKNIKIICDKYDIDLILDEVWCGTGTSGKYHNFEWDNVKPDMVFLSKTLAAGYGALSCILLGDKFSKKIKKKYNPNSIFKYPPRTLNFCCCGFRGTKGIIKNKKFFK